MTIPGAPTADLDASLDALDEADTALRALYRDLSEDPGLAGEYVALIRELHGQRIELAQRVGLAMLARRRAPSAGVAVEAPAIPSPSTEAVASAVAPESVPSVAAPADRASEAEVPGPPAVPEVPAVPPPPASDADVARWKSAVRSTGLGSGLTTALSGATAWPLVLHDLMQTLGAPRDLDGTLGVIEEVDALDDIASDAHRGRWARLPKPTQQLWLSMLVARTRGLRELPSTTLETRGRVKTVIARYPAWAKEHVPGHVNGLQLKHAPLHGSWADDARRHWDALSAVLGEESVVRAPAAPKKKAKRAASDDEDTPEIDATWRLHPVVHGRKAILLGGDPREPNRERLERAFQLASLEWPPIDGPRKVDSIVGRIRKSTYGLVVVLQPFVSHAEAEPIIEAAKSVGIPWALVEGYGVTAVRLGLERFLGGPQSGEPLTRA